MHDGNMAEGTYLSPEILWLGKPSTIFSLIIHGSDVEMKRVHVKYHIHSTESGQIPGKEILKILVDYRLEIIFGRDRYI